MHPVVPESVQPSAQRPLALVAEQRFVVVRMEAQQHIPFAEQPRHPNQIAVAVAEEAVHLRETGVVLATCRKSIRANDETNLEYES